jgi:hypothetical protein
LRQLGEALSEARVEEQARGRIGVRVADLIARVPAGGVADAAEARAGRQVRVQYGAHPVPEGEVGEAHDAAGHARCAKAVAGAHGGDAVHELGLAHRPQLGGTAGAVHRHALDEDGGDHVVTATGIGQQLVQQVAPAGMVPQVMVRVADGPRGLEDLFHDARDCTPALG